MKYIFIPLAFIVTACSGWNLLQGDAKIQAEGTVGGAHETVGLTITETVPPKPEVK